MEQLTLHEDVRSGNCYKIRLTAALLGLPLERSELRHHGRRDPHARVPRERQRQRPHPGAPGRRALPARKQRRLLVPRRRHRADPRRTDGTRADMLRWMFWEQYNHEPNIATLRFWLYFVGEANLTDVQRAQLPGKRATGEAALALMDEHLAGRDWLVGERRLARRHRALPLHPRQRGGRVPAEASYLHVGAWLRPGRGAAWLRADGVSAAFPCRAGGNAPRSGLGSGRPERGGPSIFTGEKPWPSPLP